MRSLVLLHHESSIVQGKKPEAKLSCLAVRPEEIALTSSRGETVYVASERQLPDGGVEIQIFVGNSDSPEADTPVASLQAPPEPPFELPNGRHIVDFRYIGEANALAIVLAGGDIIIVNLEEDLLPDQEKVDVVGSVESGIKAAAWSPDEELLVLITGEDSLVEMTKTFDVLTELPLYTQEFGQDKPVNVGWGAQSTQFHGSIGKAGRDAVAGLPAATRLSTSQAQDTADVFERPADNTVRISWRGDGAFFVVSALFATSGEAVSQRRLRFYSREAILQSTSEPTPGLEGSLAWQPSGSIIASSANNGRQIVFFERNGLRRYEFELKEERPEWQCSVRQLAWNSDSTVLAVWVERHLPNGDSSHVVQLWRRNNYHWYLKQCVEAPNLAGDEPLRNICWNAEVALSLYLVGSQAFERHVYHWDTFSAEHIAPNDTGAVAVVDGSRILFTPFRYQNVPPPMSSLVLQDDLGQTPVFVAFARESNTLAALMPDGQVNVWIWTFEHGNKSSMKHLGRIACGDPEFPELVGRTRPKRVIISKKESETDFCLDILVSYRPGASLPGDRLMRYSVTANGAVAPPGKHAPQIASPKAVLSVLSGPNGDTYIQKRSGEIVSRNITPRTRFPEPCPTAHVLDDSHFIGLSETGRLYCNERQLATAVTSFAVGGDFLIYTTLQHEVKFLLLASLKNGAPDEDLEIAHSQPIPQRQNGHGSEVKAEDVYGRRVERGSRIVTVMPSTMSIVLQMPRGNLETISPRPLVLQQVRKALDAKSYREAFMTCRRHRIDLNFLCDHNFGAFLQDLSIFVEQINDNEHLGLFISGLKNEDITQTMYRSLSPGAKANKDVPAKVNTVCAQLRKSLEERDLVTFANAIMTSYVCQQPQDLQSALRVISAVKPLNRSAAEDAIQYVIFLADANRLYDVALGMYDFELVLAIAQNSQKDPKEYIPFLRELRALDPHYQRHRIDDHLRKYASALRNLAEAEGERFEEALAYMQRYELYDQAVEYYSDQPARLKTVLDTRGDWLMRDDRCHEAALSYTLAGQPRKAMIAHQRALTWRELFDIAISEGLSEEDLAALAEGMGDALKAKGRHVEAARVFLDYAKDVKNAIIVLSDGNEFAEAVRIACFHARQDLLAEVVAPTALEARERLIEEAEELKVQIQKQTDRLAELRAKRVNDSSTYYGRLLPNGGDDALANVDVQTEAGGSVATTQFTRYTVAPASTRTGTVKSGQTRKTARKALRKAAGGAKGSIFEESYLLGSLGRTVAEGGKLPLLVASTASLLRAMVRLSALPEVVESLASDEEVEGDLLTLARSLESTVADLVSFARSTVDAVWEALGDAQLHDLEAALLADADEEAAAKAESALKRPEKPKFASLGHWQVPLIGLLTKSGSS